jgi:hypothetical protein
MTRNTRALKLLLAVLALMAFVSVAAGVAQASPLSDDSGAEWRREQPEPPEPEPGVEKPAFQVGLGKVGDIAFYSPNRGALITAGNGSTVPAGVWLYNGIRWRELATECGATDGRIAWSGPDEFWTVSDGRPGQAPNPQGLLPPLQDDTLCRFRAEPPEHPKFEIVGSYATLGFLSNSYEAMHAAACLSANDCWFGGEPLTAPAKGAFQLHWNGSNVVSEPYIEDGHTIAGMAPFEGNLYESLLLRSSDWEATQSSESTPLRRIVGEGEPVSYETKLDPPRLAPPLYGPGEAQVSLDSLRVSSDEDGLWAAAGPSPTESGGREAPGVTVTRYSRTQYVPAQGEYLTEESPSWTTLVGPESSPTGVERFGEEEAVTSIAAEPGTHAAWIALDTTLDEQKPNSTAPARLVRVEADGHVGDEVLLPENSRPLGPTGAAAHLACPAQHDCWLVTSQGWLFHLSVAGEAVEGPADSAFAEAPEEQPITSRPSDESTPQTELNTQPEQDALKDETANEASITPVLAEPFLRVPVPLLTHMRSHLIHGTTLELTFHLAVKAHVQLIAKRHGRVVAKTVQLTLGAGNRKLLLHLNRKRWPTGLSLKTHNLAPLPTVSTRESGSQTNAVSTSERLPARLGPSGWNARG